jgi:membrane dipeptidase
MNSIVARWGRFLALALLSGIARPEATAAERLAVIVTDAARRVHAAGFVFDGHNDLPWAIRTDFSSSFDQADISRHVSKLQTDIPRLKQGNVGAQFWSVYVPAETATDGTAFGQREESPR